MTADPLQQDKEVEKLEIELKQLFADMQKACADFEGDSASLFEKLETDILIEKQAQNETDKAITRIVKEGVGEVTDAEKGIALSDE